MDFSFLSKYYHFLLTGTYNTLLISACTVIFGTLLGIVLALMNMSHKKISLVSKVYIAVIRGTPLLVQLYIVYYGLNKMPMFLAGVIALTLNSAAYIAEIIRSGIKSVDKGQFEAAKAFALSPYQSYKEIILPQAIRNILPALGNEFIVLIKESAIVSVIGLHDLMYKVDTIRGITYKPFEPLLIAAGIYLLMTSVMSAGVKTLERKLLLD